MFGDSAFFKAEDDGERVVEVQRLLFRALTYVSIVIRPQASLGEAGRGSTTPPAYNFANYLTVRRLSPAVNPVCWAPACFWHGGSGVRIFYQNVNVLFAVG